MRNIFVLLNWLVLTLTGLASPQIASSVFTLGTAAVLPFYALMIFAPKAEMVSFVSLRGKSHLSIFSSMNFDVSVHYV